jgi:hypothetical protein
MRQAYSRDSEQARRSRPMGNIYSYVRLVLASWVFLGGLAILFGPTTASVEREARWRERQLRSIEADQRDEWVRDRDIEDARAQAYVRLLGVFMGGIGFASALFEAASLTARRVRQPLSNG